VSSQRLPFRALEKNILQFFMETWCWPAAPVLNGGVKDQASIRLHDRAEFRLVLLSLPHADRRLGERAALQHGIRLNVALEGDGGPV
jgi:hypothetical protein